MTVLEGLLCVLKNEEEDEGGDVDLGLDFDLDLELELWVSPVQVAARDGGRGYWDGDFIAVTAELRRE